MKAALRDSGGMRGSYVIRVRSSRSGRLLRTLRCENLIVNSLGRGYDLISRALGGDDTYGIAVDSAAIGTGTTAPTAADTGLEASAVSGISLAGADYTTPGAVVLSFFITDGQLANGTYKEFGIFVGGRLLARSLISPNLTKGSNQNITVEYTLTFS